MSTVLTAEDLDYLEKYYKPFNSTAYERATELHKKDHESLTDEERGYVDSYEGPANDEMDPDEMNSREVLYERTQSHIEKLDSMTTKEERDSYLSDLRKKVTDCTKHYSFDEHEHEHEHER